MASRKTDINLFSEMLWCSFIDVVEFSEKIEETTFNTLEAVRKIISEAEHYLEVMKNTQ